MIEFDRRTALRAGLAVGALGVAGGFAAREMTRTPSPSATKPPAPPRPAALAHRKLVVIEMAGGSDGLSMTVPYTDSRYRDLRPTTAIDAERVHPIDSALGFHPELALLAAGGAAVVPGVGIATPDLSHFEMLHRWQTGDPDGTVRPGTGFLGRLCDHLGDASAPAVGVALGTGDSRALACEKVTTLSVDAENDGLFPVFEDENVRAAWLAAQRAMAHPDRADTPLFATARAGTAAALRFSDAVATLPPAADGYPGTDLAVQLRLAARLLADDALGLRIIHIPMGADFDTHTDHPARYAALMSDLDAALAAFRADLAARRLTDRVLISAYSEFGRRVPDNGSSGLDHGAAGTALLLGPVNPGVFGEIPSLRALDADDNLRATTNMTEFYATLAESWFGVPATDVLPGAPRPIPGVIAA
ncbi:DUF1501 domain-containing protein [Nocardia yamanashiensis]|uniref:DUF1501 domain-containing protein n=1 Tax=Nocardia yamanashiensis TaxID=209247 RepID=UPI001E5A1A23|nr:DUF1501 domain-containing protein [Nocardia yamanashiensis]UGT41089.1 DUF1501 domain-containing protein [Nocardia yamanashiensis]